MKTEPSEPEIQHAIQLLREVSNWEGGMAVVPIDKQCAWDHGDGPCGMCLSNVCILLQVDEKEDVRPWVDAVAFCSWHTRCMQAGLERWRKLQ